MLDAKSHRSAGSSKPSVTHKTYLDSTENDDDALITGRACDAGTQKLPSEESQSTSTSIKEAMDILIKEIDEKRDKLRIKKALYEGNSGSQVYQAQASKGSFYKLTASKIESATKKVTIVL